MDVKQRLRQARAALDRAERYPGPGAARDVREAIGNLIEAVGEIAEHSSAPLDPPEEVRLP